MSATYKLIVGSAAEAFHTSRAKIRLYGGGFANGKTTALVADALRIAKDYPGAVMMLGRASYPKLNSTLRREFFKWCPKQWIKSFNKSENTVTLQNGTIIDFRYIDQRVSTSSGESTSNLLSANYDYIGIDQVEDPEITETDFEQLLGRLRGNTEYKGNDPSMPLTGPRFMSLTCNPTLGWVYKRVVKPVHDYRRGIYNKDLICEVGKHGLPILRDGLPIPLVEVFEASTYENAQNLAPDYIQTLEATYRGKMRDRYLLGKWVAFDGVIYEEFDMDTHVISDSMMREHIHSLRHSGYELGFKEAYDYGSVEPSCYLQAIVDGDGNLFILDGFYQPDPGIKHQADMIKALRDKNLYQEMQRYGQFMTPEILADPAVFRRTNATQYGAQGTTIAEMFYEHDIVMKRANNNTLHGIINVKQWLEIQQMRINPFTHSRGSPRLFVSEKLQWFIDEITTWRWAKNHADQSIDKPVNKDDHAMDALKYLLATETKAAKLTRRKAMTLDRRLRSWHETADEDLSRDRSHRYGAF